MNQPHLLKPFKGISKYGYKNGNDQVVIQSKYDEAFGFNNGMASIRLGCYWGYIDVQGNETFPTKNVPLDQEEMIPKELYSKFEQDDGGTERCGTSGRYTRSGATVQRESKHYRYGEGIGGSTDNYVGVIQMHWDKSFVKIYFNHGETVIANYLEKKAYDYSDLRMNQNKKMILPSYAATESSGHQQIIHWFECVLKFSSVGYVDFLLRDAVPVLQYLLSPSADKYEHEMKMKSNHTYALSETSKVEHAIKITVDWVSQLKGKLSYRITYDLESTTFPGLASVQVKYNMKEGDQEYAEPTAFFSIYSPKIQNEGLSDGAWELWNKTKS